MLIRIRSEKIESIQVATIDELRMVLEAYGEISPTHQLQQQIPRKKMNQNKYRLSNPQLSITNFSASNLKG